MDDYFDIALELVAGVEGDYSDDPADSGGRTRFGITEALAREYGYKERMRDLPWAVAVEIYRRHFWQALRLDEVAAQAPAVAIELFESGVNCGRHRAGEWLQESLNVLNYGSKFFADIAVDGWIGDQTLAALRSYLRQRKAKGESVLLKALNIKQGAHYINLAERRQKDERFVFGWIDHRVGFSKLDDLPKGMRRGKAA